MTNDGSPPVKCLTDVPAARDYLNRIGAEPRGLRGAVIKQVHGQYSRDVAAIKLDTTTGELTVRCPSGEDASAYEPTEIEALTIKAQCLVVKWPDLHPLQPGPNGLPLLPAELRDTDPEQLFAFHDEHGRVSMIQRRATAAEEDSGAPKYSPWTHWNDGEWRCCEPDGPLALFGLDQIGDHTTVFIHEGAKAARAMQRMLAGDREAKKRLAAHPFGREMEGAVHVGWIGGALSPHRTDWAVLKAKGIKRAYIVADNDDAGKSAVPEISKHLRMPTYHLNFTDEFPKSFDLADDFPAHMFGPQGRYIGPSFVSLLEPATWATDLYLPERGGKPVPYLRDHIKTQWVYADEPELFVCKDDPRIIRPADNLSKKLLKYSDSPGTARLLLKECENVATIAYAPDKPTGTVTVRGQRAFNVYRPSDIHPQAGDAQPFLDFLTYLFPVATERQLTERWTATLIARPAVRMHYGLLLISKRQGVGKGIFASVLARLVGDHNVGYPSEHDIAESQFNEWMAHKRLTVVGEIYQGQSFKAYNRLKGVVTDRDFTVNKKHQAPYRIDNWCHVIACSNSERALKMEGTDRRWFYPQLCEQPWPRTKFESLVQWLDGGGLNIIAHWAEQYGDYVKTGDQPPMTKRKQVMIEESEADELRWAREYCETSIDAGESLVISSTIALAYAKRSLGKAIYSTKRDLGIAMVEGGMAQLTKPDGQEFYLKFRQDRHRVFLSPAAQAEFQTQPNSTEAEAWLRMKLGETSHALLDQM